ncbi:MAG: hypothetical protein WCK75_05010 [Elusimicrobiota bacterium]
MKNIYLLLAVSFFGPYPCFAGGQYELGFIAGEPTGISAKRDLGGDKAVDAAAAWSFLGEKSLNLHADYLWFRNDAFKTAGGKLPLYYGLGGRIKLADKSLVGARLPVGLQYFFNDGRFTIFAEIAPVLDLFPDTGLSLSAALGFRVLLGRKIQPLAVVPSTKETPVNLSPSDTKKVESLYYKAVGAYSNNDMAAALESLNELSSIYPSYQPAAELRDKIRSVSGSK